MTIKIKKRVTENKNLKRSYDKLEFLLKEIDKKEIPPDLLNEFNKKVLNINAFSGEDKKLISIIENTYTDILKQLKKKLNITTKDYHQNNWISIGMTVFGLPFGAIMFAITKKPAFIPIGLPLGLAIGLAIGTIKDKKAKDQNRQIQIEEI